MSEVFILSSIGAIGLLYGMSLLRNPKQDTSQKSISQKPISHKPISHKPISHKPIRQKPISRKSISQKPIRQKPISRKSISNKSISQSIETSKMLFWNLNYKSFQSDAGRIIIDEINHINPDIMVLTESAHLIPGSDFGKMVKLPNYTKNHISFSLPDSNGIIIYWKNYKKMKETKGYSIKDVDGVPTKTTLSSSRPCIGVKLMGKEIINIIGLHLDHNLQEQFVIQSIQELIDELDVKKEEKLIIGGDFNEFYQYKLNTIMFNSGKLSLKSNNLKTINKKPYDLIYSNCDFISVNTAHTHISDHLPLLVNNTLKSDDYIIYNGNDWTIPQKRYLDIAHKLDHIGNDITFNAKKKAYSIDGFSIIITGPFIHIKKGKTSWYMITIMKLIVSQNTSVSKQVLVEDNDTYSIQTNYNGDKITYPLPTHI